MQDKLDASSSNYLLLSIYFADRRVLNIKSSSNTNIYFIYYVIIAYFIVSRYTKYQYKNKIGLTLSRISTYNMSGKNMEDLLISRWPFFKRVVHSKYTFSSQVSSDNASSCCLAA